MPDGSVMVSCDVCNMWYHGDCVNSVDCEDKLDWICKKLQFISIFNHV